MVSSEQKRKNYVRASLSDIIPTCTKYVGAQRPRRLLFYLKEMENEKKINSKSSLMAPLYGHSQHPPSPLPVLTTVF